MKKIFLFISLTMFASFGLFGQEKKDQPVIGVPEKEQKVRAIHMSRDEPYGLGVDSKKQEGVPEGTVTPYHWTSKNIYPGAERDYSIYVPKQYDGTKPACIMIFQDGKAYLNGGDVCAPVVFDNLIHKGQMPVTIGLFVQPGMLPENKSNRSSEYDTMDDKYARFILEELIPEVRKNYKITDDRAGWAICGLSSGGICAFNVAWQKPESFSKVVSHCGSFTNIRGGNAFPSMVRTSTAKPIRVFLQSGSNDIDNVYGNWPLANKDMAAALAYRDYDYKFVFGEGGHTLMHGGAIFPNTLRWLWRDYPGVKP